MIVHKIWTKEWKKSKYSGKKIVAQREGYFLFGFIPLFIATMWISER